jgi:plasmid stabilization system protein ParE
VKVLLAARAHERLEAIHDFVSAVDPGAADRLIVRLHLRIASLERFPGRGRRVPELPGSDVRELVEGHFRIVYRVVGNEVQVLTVFDSRLPLEREPGA